MIISCANKIRLCEVPITVTTTVKAAVKTTAIKNQLVATIRIKIRVFFVRPVRKDLSEREVLPVRRGRKVCPEVCSVMQISMP
jgi:putative ubiquitin-RnfH superfamily antitoxin RatB of RatAB toxin-antitoxin module